MASQEDRPNLDILRSLAVATVIVDHLARTLVHRYGRDRFPWLPAVMDAYVGHWGVLAFFVHTSLVLMYSLDRLDRTGRSPVALRFYLRRAFRIYPLAIVCIATAVALGLPSDTWEGIDVKATWPVVAANLLLVQNLWTKQSVISSLWSLPYEVQMYAVLPALHVFAQRSRSVVGLLGLIALFCLAGTAIALATHHLNMAAYVPCFLSGVLCYALGRAQRPRLPALLWPAFLAVLLVLYSALNHALGDPIYWNGWLLCLILGLTINLFRESTVTWANVAAREIARYSYGLYIWHLPMLYLVFDAIGVGNPLVGIALFLAATAVASVASYHLIEAPMIGVGRRLSRNPPRPEPVPVP